MTATATLNVGDKVTVAAGMFASVSPSQVFEIVKAPRTAREVNYTAQPIGGGRGVRGPAYVFVPFDGTEPTTPTATTEPWVAPLGIGVVVTVNHPKFNANDLYVVLGVSSKGGNKIAKLGGDNDRYWPSISPSLLTAQSIATSL